MTRFAFAYCLVFASLLLLADLGELNSVAQFIHDYAALDKIIHFVLYGVLALVINAALAGRRRWSLMRALAIGSVIVLVASTVEEYSNILTMHRTWSWGDLMANYLGILLVGIAPFLIRPRTSAVLGQ